MFHSNILHCSDQHQKQVIFLDNIEIFKYLGEKATSLLKRQLLILRPHNAQTEL